MESFWNERFQEKQFLIQLTEDLRSKVVFKDRLDVLCATKTQSYEEYRDSFHQLLLKSPRWIRLGLCRPVIKYEKAWKW